MRVVFMGTPEFAVPSLHTLACATKVVGVFCRPDAVSGRGRTSRHSPVKIAAEKLGLMVFQPSTLRDEFVLSALAELAPDLVVVAAYGLILPRVFLDAARLGAVNVHASLLPRWRGAAPIQRAILAGDAQTGVSIMRVEEGLDTGPYCLQVATPIGNAGAAELTARLALLGADALAEALPAIADGSATWTEQDAALVTYAEKISKADVAIAPDIPAEQAWRRIRASVGSAPCRVSIAGHGVTIVTGGLIGSAGVGLPSPGVVACAPDGIVLGMADGALLVERLKPDGRVEMASAEWTRGVRGLEGAAWGGLL